VDPTDPACTDPSSVGSDNSRIANLYSDDVLCSECFVQLMYTRLSSEYLPDHDFSDYLIDEYQDILDVCNATSNMPELVIRFPPSYDIAESPTLYFTGVDTDLSCADGQNIITSSIDPNGNCASIAQYFNVATGSIQAATKDVNCKATASSFCLPSACQLSQVPSSGNTSCDSVAASLSSANLTVTVTTLLNWNPNINGLCDSLTPGDYICAGPPGGTYIPPAPPLDSSSDQSQQRGGGDGSSTGTFGNATVQCTSAQEPAPVQDNILASCKSWCQAYPDDYCYQFAQETNITTNELFKWNPVLGDGGANCQTQFQAGYWYCVSDGNTATSTTSSVQSSSTTAASLAPSPTQSGIDGKCNLYKIAVKGDYCYQFAQDNGISTDQLYAWNKVLGQGGADCSAEFQAGEYYCVGVSS
jgi:LysM repeat protein